LPSLAACLFNHADGEKLVAALFSRRRDCIVDAALARTGFSSRRQACSLTPMAAMGREPIPHEGGALVGH
jgi:hypothetical protein